MPFGRYGVLAGTLHRHFRDRPDDQGRWFHVNLEVDAPDGRYRCAVDVDSKNTTTGVQWKTYTVAPSALGPVTALPPGYHELARVNGSGALDYQRHPVLADLPGCLSFLRRLLPPPRRWTTGSNLDAAAALEPILEPGRRILVFGEPFDHGLGVHNVHQNQGDPYGSQWWDENGIWQDGGTATFRPDGRLDIFISKFSTQSDHTDNDGHPG
ncbi:DUF2278 family protein [Paractinoplanes lichenicola]|uniref:DUF2278 family protein n=1 Tax=Paractinoplanes lichenicola TaxID=2802976 RepID=A0ABS1VXY3_9ACTN|nr:DUF2278 family protein [Actinoplanes lichenicola]MBL7259335.1 DUF2278 family protein [Actinoplanes lichenicola]